MPNYDYRCTKCEHTFEEFLSISSRQKPCRKPCPKCGKKGVEQYIASAPSFADPVSVGKTGRLDGGFRDVISKIKKAHPRNNIPDY